MKWTIRFAFEGNDEVHLAAGADVINLGEESGAEATSDGHDTIYGFGAEDRIVLWGLPSSEPGLEVLDTNHDGALVLCQR